MNETDDSLERAFELLKSPVPGVDSDVSKKRVEELMMREFSQTRFRSRRKVLLAALLILSLIATGGAVAATTGALKVIRTFIVGPNGTQYELELHVQETGESAAVLHLPEGTGNIPAGAEIELRASE